MTREPLNPVFWVTLAASVTAAAVGVWLRFALIEAPGMDELCASASGVRCLLRAGAIGVLQGQALSWLGLALVGIGAVSWWLRFGRMALIVIVLGALGGAGGTLLYGPEPGLMAVLLALALAANFYRRVPRSESMPSP